MPPGLNRMAIRTTYRPGDFLRDCDRCGETVYASETKKQWDGLIVCAIGCFEERHPQDFVRGRVDRQNVPDPRPVPTARFVGTLDTVTTAAAVSGQTFVLVESTARMLAGDRINIALNDGNMALMTIQTVVSSVRLNLASGLPGSVAEGAIVVDMTAVSTADIG